MRYIKVFPDHVPAHGNATGVLGLVGLPDRARSIANGGRNRGGATAP